MTYGSSIFTSWFQLICGSQQSQLEFVLWWCEAWWWICESLSLWANFRFVTQKNLQLSFLEISLISTTTCSGAASLSMTASVMVTKYAMYLWLAPITVSLLHDFYIGMHITYDMHSLCSMLRIWGEVLDIDGIIGHAQTVCCRQVRIKYQSLQVCQWIPASIMV